MLPIADENEPGAGPAFVTWALIALNVAVFFLLQGAGANEAFTYGYSAVPAEITTGVDITTPTEIDVNQQVVVIPQEPGPRPIWLTLFTSMFMHGGLLHLGGNMLFLWIFGDNVEHRAGPILFLVGYLVAGLVGSLAEIASSPSSPIPSLGASGAISGVLGAYIVLYPGNRVTAFIFRFLLQVPAWVVLGMWIALQLFNGFAVADSAAVGGVAYLAHVGGFATGLLAGFLLLRLPDAGARRGP
jgi:membrane associated rhomboid family serine protease